MNHQPTQAAFFDEKIRQDGSRRWKLRYELRHINLDRYKEKTDSKEKQKTWRTIGKTQEPKRKCRIQRNLDSLKVVAYLKYDRKWKLPKTILMNLQYYIHVLLKKYYEYDRLALILNALHIEL